MLFVSIVVFFSSLAPILASTYSYTKAGIRESLGSRAPDHHKPQIKDSPPTNHEDAVKDLKSMLDDSTASIRQEMKHNPAMMEAVQRLVGRDDIFEDAFNTIDKMMRDGLEGFANDGVQPIEELMERWPQLKNEVDLLDLKGKPIVKDAYDGKGKVARDHRDEEKSDVDSEDGDEGDVRWTERDEL